ncbi:hypothetical protein RHRU231_650005 [Rhodococcus ruber]|uniref:Uncharacterized protein n=1 Tax=Rhodococcus ruber TaxID=1830 RepID=A0A098BPH4_9NOCA|nr:hypothetical protein RHRU231_650005 [Rhodococcus ruber]
MSGVVKWGDTIFPRRTGTDASVTRL